ncbi:MarR family winged helix-turn-helix transcriptional regulator [Jannaschia sp. R86511]|uniref:MarR family winged helix-turn-helix transcriptional regulator n=1 Tax=Jannaschia sp. R86511 TaxID=3093853 RepID=UPI0036D27A42
MLDDGGPGPEVGRRLGYLLKHAQARLGDLYEQALATFDVDVRELGVLMLLGSHEPASQQQAAARLGVDRTSMVAVLDALEAKGYASRRPDAADRRRNVVQLTAAGREVLLAGAAASEQAERALLAPLGPAEAERFRQALRRVAQDRLR